MNYVSRQRHERRVAKVDTDFMNDMEEFITQRINWHGQNESDAVSSAYMELRYCVERLSEALTEEQQLLLRECINTHQVTDGEMSRFYFKAGFRDALLFLHYSDTSRA